MFGTRGCSSLRYLFREASVSGLCGRIKGLVEVCIAEIEFVDHAFVADDIDVAAFIRPKGGDALRRCADLPNHHQLPVSLSQTPDAFRCIVAADIHAIKGRVLSPR